VVTLPCFHRIARTFADAKRRLLSNFPVDAKAPASEAVLYGSGLVHGYMCYTVGTRNFGELLRLMWDIHGQQSISGDVVVIRMTDESDDCRERNNLINTLPGRIE
jgi:hypothetical protein